MAYGVGAYKYRQRIRALPQLPTANYRLKPPGLSGCAACGGLGAAETSGNIIPFALLGIAAAVVWFLSATPSKTKSSRGTWYPVLHGSRTKAEALKRSKNIDDSYPITKVKQDKDGTWTVWGLD